MKRNRKIGYLKKKKMQTAVTACENNQIVGMNEDFKEVITKILN